MAPDKLYDKATIFSAEIVKIIALGDRNAVAFPACGMRANELRLSDRYSPDRD